MSPLVSIIIPCYNAEAYIEQALKSVLAQTYRQTEIIVIDDGSSDDSLSIIRAFGECLRWETGPNCGAPTARNRGLALARGEFVKFLDADDCLLSDCLTRQVAQTVSLPAKHKAIVYGDAVWVDHAGQPLPGFAHQFRQANEDPIAHILTHSPLTSCPLHKRRYLQAIGGFDTTLLRGQEDDLHLRLTLSGVQFVHNSGPVYHYREHQQAQRISGQGLSHQGPLMKFKLLQKQRQLIETQTEKPLTPAVRTALAHRFWASGRAILREGFATEASHYFVAARDLDAKRCISGKRPYPTLVQWFGPHRAESAMTKLRGLWSR